MTVGVRHSGAMLARTALNSSRCTALALPIRSRPISIQMASFHSSSAALESKPKTRPATRRNPLIGGGQRSPAKEQPQAPQTPHTTPPTTAPNVDSPLEDYTPPPPPPPPAEQPGRPGGSQPGRGRNAQTSEERRQQQYTYDAASPSGAFDDVNKPLELDISAIIANKAAAFGREFGQGDPTKQPKIQPAAATGRTVFVRGGRSSAGTATAPTPVLALRQLDRILRQQKVKAKSNSQRFHERRGLKKKRLLRVRWRSRFKAGFQAACDRVYELKRQGW